MTRNRERPWRRWILVLAIALVASTAPDPDAGAGEVADPAAEVAPRLGGDANRDGIIDGAIGADDVAAGLVGAVVKDPVVDRIVWQEYLETVVRERRGWKDLYRACRELT